MQTQLDVQRQRRPEHRYPHPNRDRALMNATALLRPVTQKNMEAPGWPGTGMRGSAENAAPAFLARPLPPSSSHPPISSPRLRSLVYVQWRRSSLPAADVTLRTSRPADRKRGPYMGSDAAGAIGSHPAVSNQVLVCQTIPSRWHR